MQQNHFNLQFCDRCGKALKNNYTLFGSECLCTSCTSKAKQITKQEQQFFNEINYFKQNHTNKVNIII